MNKVSNTSRNIIIDLNLKEQCSICASQLFCYDCLNEQMGGNFRMLLNLYSLLCFI